MKYVITGASGNTGRPISRALLAQNHQVTVITRNAEHVKDLQDLGARVATGDVEDIAFLKAAFRDADAVYTMVPPNWNPTNWKEWIGHIGENYATAIRDSSIRKVVNLSSVGADKPEGLGPITGLHRVEQALNTLSGVDILHLRPVYFYQNLLSNIPLVKHNHIMGSNVGGHLYLVDPADIVTVATTALLNPDFTGKTVRYIVSDKKQTSDIARIIGQAVGQPDLPWVTFSDQDSLQGMLQAGLPEEVAKNYVEMGAGLRSGSAYEDLENHLPEKWGSTKLEDFANVFAAVYRQS